VRRALAAVALLCVWAPAAQAATPGEVDPFIGVDGEGNVYPGAGVPFGFARVSPDTTRASPAGYSSSGQILGFSQTHVSGVGGGGSMYGNLRLTPVSGRLRVPETGSGFRGERAAPGSYAVSLTRPGVRAEMTATRLGGLLRFGFGRRGGRHLVLDASSAVGVPGAPRPLGARLRVVGRRAVEGSVRMAGGWNEARYTLHFALRFDRPFRRAGTFRGERASRRRALRSGRGTRAGAWASFAQRGVTARIGLSFRSVGRARRNLARELGRRSLARVRGAARRAWGSVLGRIHVEGGSRAERRLLATGLYRSHLMPHDLSGENAWWRSRKPHYEDFYTLWDTHRTLHPLLALLQPRRQSQMVESLVDTYRHTGWIPTARIAGANGQTQVGSLAGVLVAEARAKGLRGIDYRTALRALVKDAEVESPRPLRHGRQLRDYLSLGYLSLSEGRSASRTLEYAYADSALADLAASLGRGDLAARYRWRSGSWANLWDPATRTVRPRSRDGRFLSPFDPDRLYTGFADPYYEGTARQWSTFVPHDIPGLMARVGGREAFVRWLDALFSGGRFSPGNEHDLLAPWLYLYAGRHDRTAAVMRRLLGDEWAPRRDGLPGNDDAGALSSWYVWGAIGLFPHAGRSTVFIGSPLFRRVRIAVGRRRSFVIEAPATAPGRPYVARATLNGRPLDRAWLSHRELTRGGRLVLSMSERPGSFGAGRPPP
jgi:predicted alpha-1,2-mannosidase